MPAYKIGLMGKPNTGKSYSRMSTDANIGFVIMPDLSDPYLVKNRETSERVDPFNFMFEGKNFTKTIASVLGVKYDEDDETTTINLIVEAIITKKDSLVDNFKGDAKTKEKTAKIFDNISKFCTGNYVVCPDLSNLKNWLKFISKYMPHIQHIFLPDFTHFLTNVVASKEFSDKGKSAGGAYSRYTDLATTTVTTFFTETISKLRNDIIIIIEFHITTNKDTEENKIFIPSGQMLDSTFILESYLDMLLGTKQVFGEKDNSKRYLFITEADEHNQYIRSAGLLPNGTMPNDLSIVIDAYKKANPNKFNKYKTITEENANV